MFRRSLFSLGLALATGSCATAYQRTGLTGGFSDTQLAENVFQVNFNGNGFTSFERASDFALLRSAELAADHGYPFFLIVDAQTGASRSAYTTPTTTTGSATVVGNTVYGTATTTGGQTYVVTKPSARNTVVGLRDKPIGFAYESQYVIRSLRAKYGIAENKAGSSSSAATSQSMSTLRWSLVRSSDSSGIRYCSYKNPTGGAYTSTLPTSQTCPAVGQ